MKKKLLDEFWNIYDEQGTVKALTWLESLKYYENYCSSDINDIINSVKNIKLN